MKKDYKLKLTLLKRLSQGGFHSGEALGAEFGISRAAISKHIQAIQEWGVDIYSLKGKGYQLAQPLQLLDEAVLKAAVDAPLELIPIIGSTNQHLMDKVDRLDSGAVCIAEYQSQGRGRRGREWVSPFGANLYMSMFWRLETGMAAAMGLSLVVGVAIVEALESLGLEGIKLKWPNDLYHNDRKLAGILVELSGQAGGAANVVIGMGMNLSMDMKVKGITQPWTSLNQVAQEVAAMQDKTLDRNQLAITLINTLRRTLEDYELHGMAGFVERWNRIDNYLNRPIKLLMGKREITGIERGINEQGGVLIETENGLEAYIGGEISLRSNA